MTIQIQYSRLSNKQLRRLPAYIKENLDEWINMIKLYGIEETRKIIGYHDEPLTGQRKGQRSIRLSRSYRVIYRVLKNEIVIILILEVNKHDY